jgi:hypothetical protein
VISHASGGPRRSRAHAAAPKIASQPPSNHAATDGNVGAALDCERFADQASA